MKTFLKPLTISEERVFLEQLKQGERKAKDVLVERNMRLVAHIVKKYSQTDYEMEDLISIGTIGLIKAVDTFNPDRANRLGTYAAKCIDNAILSQIVYNTLFTLFVLHSTQQMSTICFWMKCS